MTKKSQPADNEQLDEQEIEIKSKTAIKNEMHALQELGTALTELSDKQLMQIPLDPLLENAIKEARSIKQREARRRHLQYIGKLMRKTDHTAIAQAYQILKDKDRRYIKQHHQAENWRDRLINEDNAALNSFLQDYPETDIQHIRQLIRTAKKEQQQNKPPAAARKLFKYIRDHM